MTTSYFLRRNGWSLETIEGIISNMKTDAKVVHSKEALPHGDYYIRWGCTANIPGEPKIINHAKAIHAVYDKSSFRKVLNANGLCPETWFSDLFKNITFPCVVRPKIHCQAENFHVCTNENEIFPAVMKCGEGFYISKFIKKASEYRVFVAQGRVVTVLRKWPKVTGQEVWNDIEEYVGFTEWPMAVVKAAVEAHNLSELHWSAVDIIVDKEKKPYVLELNTAPEIQSPYRQKCMAKVFDWMVTQSTKDIPIINVYAHWKKYIHPAISSEAILSI